MGIFYFDESIHPRGGFIVGAFVFAPVELDADVGKVLIHHGLRPGIDEYKSSATMAAKPQLDALREDVRRLLVRCSVGLVVIPHDDRSFLGTVALRALNQFVGANRLADEPHRVFMDAGIDPPPAMDEAQILTLGGLHPDSDVYFGSDSRSSHGLQLADCAAHTAATVLLEEVGLVRKEVPGRAAHGWDPDELYPLGFELWAPMRHALFNGGLSPEPRGDNMFVNVYPYGLYIAPDCPPHLAEQAMKRFGTAYLGCIH